MNWIYNELDWHLCHSLNDECRNWALAKQLENLFFPHSQIILVGSIVFLKKVCTFATHFGQKPFWSEN